MSAVEEEGYMALNFKPRTGHGEHNRLSHVQGAPQQCTQWHRVALGVASVVILLLIRAVITLASWDLQAKGTLNGTQHLPDSEFRLQLKHFACNSLGNSTEEDVKKCKICPQDWRLYRESCYWISEQEKTWAKSQEDCRGKNSILIVIQNLEEMKFIQNLTRMIRQSFWLGLTAKKYERWIWEWVDGSPFKEELFSVKHPAEEDSCVLKWVDTVESDACGSMNRWICEKTAFQV